MSNNIEFIDVDDNRSNQKIDYNSILMEQINKVRVSGSVEFRGGYWDERKRMINGSLVIDKIYIPDTRQVYIGSVTQLYDLLLPYFDDKFRKKDKEIQIKIKEHKDAREEEKKKRAKNEFNVWYYTTLMKYKRKQYKQLLLLISRLGMLGIKKSKEVY